MAGRVILLLCGIPGAGKSTLARRIYDKYTEDNQSALVISYDHFQQPKGNY
jgi:adenylate kinase family enzyme